MSDQTDWLQQTWDIKSKLAEKYAGRPASEQLRDMRDRVEREWEKRGWALTDRPAAHEAMR